MRKLGVIGFGHMAQTMLSGAADFGVIAPDDALVYDVSDSRMKEASRLGYGVASNGRAVYEGCRYLLLAVLPQNADGALSGLSGCGCVPPVIISIVSGMGSSYIRKFLGEGVRVINLVPNLTISVGFGACAASRTENVPDKLWQAFLEVLGRFGQVAAVDEARLTEIIPANGCAPGYAFYLIDAVASACAEGGVDYGLAVKMAAASFAGAGKILLESNLGPAEQLARVCSPGGLTAKGIEYFNSCGIAKSIGEGVCESAKRGRELALS
ncbi:MAG: NAD(P)-binding domain-containing protein [Defluviitaleaceae bacterium]|nr:NAD(P)-binding domain-containing protein [Defluviitaleaceae bacterium]